MRTTDVQRLVYKLLTQNTGIHFLDSGFANGRAWQRNQKKTIKDFMNEPEESYQFDMKFGDIYRTVSVFHYLSGLELDDTCLKFNRRNNNPADWEGELPGEDIYGVSRRAADWLNENHEVEVRYTFNTYNGDSDLSQILQGSRLEIDGDTYYLIQVHGGADARGGYTDAKLFKTSYYSEGIHEYLWEYKHSSEIEDDLREGYIESMTDYWDSSIVYDNETILKRIDGLLEEKSMTQKRKATLHSRLVHINRIDDEYWQMKLFEPSDNMWFELLTFDLDSLVLQANIIYNIDLREYLN